MNDVEDAMGWMYKAIVYISLFIIVSYWVGGVIIESLDAETITKENALCQ